MERNPLYRYLRPEDSPGYQLWLVSNLWQRRARAALKDYNLTHVQFAVLSIAGWLNREGEPVTQAQIARTCGIDEMMTSQVVRTLVKRGYLKRKRHPSDSRAQQVTLTDEGAALAPEAVARMDASDDDLFNVLGDDKDVLLRLLQRVSQQEAND